MFAFEDSGTSVASEVNRASDNETLHKIFCDHSRQIRSLQLLCFVCMQV